MLAPCGTVMLMWWPRAAEEMHTIDMISFPMAVYVAQANAGGWWEPDAKFRVTSPCCWREALKETLTALYSVSSSCQPAFFPVLHAPHRYCRIISVINIWSLLLFSLQLKSLCVNFQTHLVTFSSVEELYILFTQLTLSFKAFLSKISSIHASKSPFCVNLSFTSSPSVHTPQPSSSLCYFQLCWIGFR